MSIKEMLLDIGAVSEDSLYLFSNRTRDVENLPVWRDRSSGVIFIDNFYVGKDEYINGRSDNNISCRYQFTSDLEDKNDTERRINKYMQFICDKDVCDYGCGIGSFLKSANPHAKSVIGIELNVSHRDYINSCGIQCNESISQASTNFDLVTMFHCLEHLENPISSVVEIYSKLKKNGEGMIIVEVPHARDFLIDFLNQESFINFSLWSQHLILHTRHSLRLLLSRCGFKNILIEGVQRYPLSNHLFWLAEGRPGGHKSVLSILDSNQLTSSYEMALNAINATDTLVAIATT